jgi:hypothetical protein
MAGRRQQAGGAPWSPEEWLAVGVRPLIVNGPPCWPSQGIGDELASGAAVRLVAHPSPGEASPWRRERRET